MDDGKLWAGIYNLYLVLLGGSLSITVAQSERLPQARSLSDEMVVKFTPQSTSL